MSWLLRSLRLLLVCLFAAGQARAEAPANGTILLVVDERAGALATRVAAELETLGFSVETQAREPNPNELTQAARSAGAFAAIGIGPTASGSVEITVLDRVTGKTLRRELLGQSLSDPTTRELVALRAAELLRASLMEIEAPHPPRGELPATPRVRRVASAPETLRRPDHPFRLGVEGGALVAPGLSTAPLLQAQFGARMLPRLELGITVGSQLTPSERELELGRLESTARWLGVGPRFVLLPRTARSRVELGISASFGALSLSASGFASDASHRGSSRSAYSPAVTFGIDSKIRLYEQFWWSLRPSLGLATRTLGLRVDERDVKVWGKPWLWCATGLEVEL